MERLRVEQSEVYRLFTENDKKIVADYIDNKEKINAEITLFKTRICLFDNELHSVKNKLQQQDITVKEHKNIMDET